ncbi:DNA replication complex GINS protein PSF2 [Wickerhamiella sorbophila]|uniref:DNA replication complex GINS protein PSF2 n=1 Tax=Wickerhamiella sorbophila TaxID=45607 RepID=A0A2T0FGP4_9ASCO|nr:DNA replication complex GINS protein PSF2 [Wickerhamiella sorbophila]PRT54119.1 DNA replication complex GINS protein PSF2 [Wickerhamiella sorbophila]
MALPGAYLEAFTAEEISFQAEDELITIIPRRHIQEMQLAGWKLPALRPMRRTDVPLWLALLLKKQDRCSIVFPNWMDEAVLKDFVEKERVEPGFSSLPWFWQPQSAALLAGASDDYTGNLDNIRQLLQDLREIRQAKVRQGITLVNESHMQMDGLSLMELNEVRPLMSKTMATLQKLHQ